LMAIHHCGITPLKWYKVAHVTTNENPTIRDVRNRNRNTQSYT
jgi:hypothetical protein